MASQSILRLAVLVALALDAAAESLTWENREQTVDVPWDAAAASAIYRFTNTGSTAVTITAVRPSCGCIVTKPEQERIAPGASSAITASMQVGHRSGRISREISVLTDEPGAAPTTLTFTAVIPVIATIRPSFLHWRLGDEATAQTSVVRIAPEFPLSIETVTGNPEQVRIAWTPDEGARSGTIAVTPRRTDLPWNGVVVVRATGGREFLLFCRCVAPDATVTGGADHGAKR